MAEQVFGKHFAAQGDEEHFPVSIIVTCKQQSTCGPTGNIMNDTNVITLIDQVQKQ